MKNEVWHTSLLAAFDNEPIFFTATGFCFDFQNALYTQPCPPSPITSVSFKMMSPATISIIKLYLFQIINAPGTIILLLTQMENNPS